MPLIELDRDAPPDPAADRRPPPRRYRPTGLLLTAALLLALGGAAPANPVLWRDLGSIDMGDGPETPVQLAGGRLFTSGVQGRQRAVTAWSLDRQPHRLWTAPVPLAMNYRPSTGTFGVFTVRQAGDVVLVSGGPATVALDARTGKRLWDAPVTVMVLGAGRAGVTVERIFRPGTVYDQSSGDPGPLFFSAAGEPHTEPPVRTEVRGLDLATGKAVWTATPRGSVTVDPVHGDGPAVLITASDRLTLHDGATGQVRAEAALPEINGSGPVTASVAGDVALVGYQDPGQQVAYDVRSLRRLWSRAMPDLPGDTADCRQVICSGPRNDLWVLDPATGERAWPANGDVDLTVRAGYVLETEVRTGRPDRLADPATGANRMVLTGWDEVLPGEPEGTVVVRREQTFAAVVPGQRQLRLLGTVDAGAGECAADGRRLVCRYGSELRVWAYRI